MEVSAMIRSMLAVLAGFVTWFVVATLGNFLIRALLPGYQAAEPAMTFTLAMLVARLGLAIVSGLAAGYTCSAVARGDVRAVYACAALLVLCFLPIHFKLWAKFPLWYHLFFLVTLAPLVVWGAALRRRGQARAAAPAN
jgi:hypothetical protein